MKKEINFKDLIPDEYYNLLDQKIIKETEIKFNNELIKTNLNIFPKSDNIFRIFKECKLNQIRVVILGQDVYHSNENQANGIAFSVNDGIPLPPSLKNIYKELLNCYPNTKVNGNLTNWVKQGVFLLNCSLTVVQARPGSHMSIWSHFTDHIIKLISEKREKIIFCLWGKFGESKEFLINKNRGHIILKCSHPSPLSAYKTNTPFIGSKIFKQINEHLDEKILW